MKRILGTFLIGGTAFAGGLIAGLLLTPKSGRENRELINDYGKETKHWLEQQSRKIKSDSEKQIDRVSNRIRTKVKNAVPDLYEATENLHFSEEEEIEEISKHG
ncbi:MAG: YtxH domain-containing protein [Gracilimonas sp.]|jgi:gas vesicle protein|nr:YtxH domain-containing protein [Gracilimonas sp.]